LIRRIQLGGNYPVLISDTVGFIRKLPHLLVSAFRATLEEVVVADLILHVIDVSDPDHEDKRAVVIDVLREIGAANHRCLTVYNKADLLDENSMSGLTSNMLLVSAVSGRGLDILVHDIMEQVGQGRGAALV
jgi:GTP-binding protein HflX